MDKVLKKMLDEEKISRSAYVKLIEGKVENDSEIESGLKISVLISTYRRHAFLIQLLDSIKMQQYQNHEIIIADDASDDDTEKAVKQYEAENLDLNIIYFVNERNLGVSESKKRAYLKASGDIIIFADDDDYFIEPTYFSRLNQLYKNHSDCTMTIAAMIQHFERDGVYKFFELNTPEVLGSREYLNGFMGRYRKPVVLTMSLKSTALKTIHYEELLCFNDTSLFLFGLFGKGNVYTINQAVGVYRFHTGNITGNTLPGFIIANLKSKEDIYQRAMKAGLLDDPKEWHYRNMSITAGYHLEGTQNRTKEDKLVWKWMKDHLDRKDYYRFVARVIKARIRHKMYRKFRARYKT